MRSSLVSSGKGMALVWALVAVGAGCEQDAKVDAPARPAALEPGAAPAVEAGSLAPAASEPEAPATEAEAEAEAEVDPAALVPAPRATELAALPVRLPQGWQGTGVLARRGERLPRRAPAWARVLAEVTLRDGQRFLVATGRVARVRDAQLARSTAENRARSELARWTRTEKQTGGAISEVWRDRRTGDTFARVELPVPPQWVPGTPLGGA